MMAIVYRTVGVQVARIAGLSSEMDAAAEKVAQTARALAASHNVTGEFLANIGTSEIRGKRGVTDRIAYVDHEAAVSIEFGHVQAAGKGHYGPGRYVEGLHIFGKAAGVR